MAVRWSAAITLRIWTTRFDAEGELTDTEYTALRIAGIRLRQLGWPRAVTEALEAAGKGYEERELARLRGDLHRWSSESLFPTAD